MTTKEKIREWLVKGKETENAEFMVVLCDKFSYDDFPVYIAGSKKPQDTVDKLLLSNSNAFMVMECYKLSKDWDEQLNAVRAQNWI